MSPAANAQFGQYETLAPFGAGGMGGVYRAKDTWLNREIAIKILPASFVTNTDVCFLEAGASSFG